MPSEQPSQSAPFDLGLFGLLALGFATLGVMVYFLITTSLGHEFDPLLHVSGTFIYGDPGGCHVHVIRDSPEDIVTTLVIPILSLVSAFALERMIAQGAAVPPRRVPHLNHFGPKLHINRPAVPACRSTEAFYSNTSSDERRAPLEFGRLGLITLGVAFLIVLVNFLFSSIVDDHSLYALIKDWTSWDLSGWEQQLQFGVSSVPPGFFEQPNGTLTYTQGGFAYVVASAILLSSLAIAIFIERKICIGLGRRAN